MSHELCSTALDEAFCQIQGLTWAPWVGKNFLARPANRRLLVVGESHYVKPVEPAQLDTLMADHLKYREYTRDIVSECLIDQDWPNRTLDNVPRLLFQTDDLDRPRLWSDTAFYNFVQTPMHYNREAGPERPSEEQFRAGWPIFLDLLRMLQPSHCLFIGVEAFCTFNSVLPTLGREFTPMQWTEQVGRTYGRKAAVKVEDKEITLIGVQHLGKYFSWSNWHSYLVKQHPDLMEFLAEEAYS